MSIGCFAECTFYVDGKVDAGDYSVILPAGAQVLAAEAVPHNNIGKLIVWSDDIWMYSSVYQEGWNGIHFCAEPSLWQTAIKLEGKVTTHSDNSTKLFYFRNVLGRA